MDLHLLFAAINFSLFAGLLYVLLRRPLKEFWGNRAESLRTRIAQAKERRTKAETQFMSLSARVKRMEQEMQELRERLRHDGELEKKKILENAEASATRLDEATKRIAEQELTKSRYCLRQAAVRFTVEAAQRTLRSQITTDDHDRMAREYLDQLAVENLTGLEGGVA